MLNSRETEIFDSDLEKERLQNVLGRRNLNDRSRPGIYFRSPESNAKKASPRVREIFDSNFEQRRLRNVLGRFKGNDQSQLFTFC